MDLLNRHRIPLHRTRAAITTSRLLGERRQDAVALNDKATGALQNNEYWEELNLL